MELRAVSPKIVLGISILVIFDVFIWTQILFYGSPRNTEFYFLDVGQGDSELVLLPGGVKILIDGGPDSRVLDELGSILRPTDRYIDLVLMSHPQLDHFNGLIEVLRRYKVGAFISSGKNGAARSFKDLIKTIQDEKLKSFVLGEGDKIKYRDSQFDILSPAPDLLLNKEPNYWALVIKLRSSGLKALYTGDIDSKIEKRLVQKYDVDLDILKVAHHGSKFSSSLEFLKAASPKVALIEVGKNNSYGHPTPQVLGRLASIGAKIFRTDKNGVIKLVAVDSQLNVFTQK